MIRTQELESEFQEIVTPEELHSLSSGSTGYIGFEPSGLPHIATGIMWPRKINRLVDSGISMKVLLADWHAMVNDKLGGDLQRIRESGTLMMKCMKAQGLYSEVEFVWADDLVSGSDYWKKLLMVAKNSNLSRIRRALPIMGRSEDDADSDFSKYIYPLMQVTDIFFMKLDVAVGGMDQRHAHMLARDIAAKMGEKKPVSLHAPLLGSLKGSGRMDSFKKMSKSDPDSAIFMSDSRKDVERKIKSAFCPVAEIEGNPLVEIMKHVVFPYLGREIIINRPQSKGGDITFRSYGEFELEYSSGKIHPMDLKAALSSYLNEMMEPSRSVFS
ncbi:MAG: tyrosine--tRNA ligase [Thermoplasmataceae archaeon]